MYFLAVSRNFFLRAYLDSGDVLSVVLVCLRYWLSLSW